MSGINPFSFLSGMTSAVTGTSYPVQQADIIALSPALTSIKQAVQIKGEITAQNPDGTFQIKTPQGDVTIKLPTPLPVGTKLDLQIPAGQAPKEAFIQPLTIRQKPSEPSPPSTAQQDGSKPQTSPPPSGQQVKVTDSAATLPPRPAPQQAPSPDVKALQSTTQQANISVSQRGDTPATRQPLTIGQPVRMTPLPATMQTLAALPVRYTQTVQTTITSTLTSLNTTASSPLAILPSLSGVPQASTAAANAKPQQPTHEALPPRQIAPVPQITAPQITRSVLPPDVIMKVSGDRTPRPVITTLQTNPTPSALPMTVETAQVTETNRIPLLRTPPLDARIRMMVEPMHIRPPLMSGTAVNMSSASLSVIGNYAPAPSVTLFNGYAGEALAVSTGYVTDDGQPILQIILPALQAPMVAVNYPSKDLPAGTQITLSPLPRPQTIPDFASSSPVPNLQALEEQILKFLPPQQALALHEMMPNPANPRQFPAAALLFLAAAKGGDLSAWLGTRTTRNVESLSAKDPKAAVQKLLSEVLSAGNGRAPLPSDPQPVQNGDWRGHVLPLFSETDFHNVTLWVKHDEKNDGGNNRPQAGTRFIVDLSLSRMGAIQFDGLIHPTRKTLDLSFITQRKLAQPMQDKLKTIWYNALDNLDYSGSIAFREQ